jgi:hypothetical protein
LIAVALGKQVADIPFLVAVAAVDERVLAEDVLDRGVCPVKCVWSW